MTEERLIERITICVEPELKQLYEELTGKGRTKRVRVAEMLRRYMREKLPEIKRQLTDGSAA